MLYWQAGQIHSSDEVPIGAGNYIRAKIAEIRGVLGSPTTELKVMPTISITTSVDFEDGGNANLDYYDWKRSQLNVLGAIADEGLAGYDLFYHGNWLWPVYQENTNLGKWLDWAAYLANLSTRVGALQVNIGPEGAVIAGAQWRRFGTIAWRSSGFVETGIPVGDYVVEFRPITGWDAPESMNATIESNHTLTLSAVYVEQTGSLRVMLSPSEVIAAGAQWRVDGGAWHNSGYTQTGLTVGQHEVEFSSIADWATPPPRPLLLATTSLPQQLARISNTLAL